MSNPAYFETALQDARDRGLTPAQVMQADYVQVLQACGFTQATRPDYFVYRNVRRWVALHLKREQDDARDEQRRLAIRAKVRELVDLTGAEIERTDDEKVFLVRLP